MEQHVVSLKEYLKTGITGYTGQRGLPSPENRMSYVKKLITELPIILKECEDKMECHGIENYDVRLNLKRGNKGEEE